MPRRSRSAASRSGVASWCAPPTRKTRCGPPSRCFAPAPAARSSSGLRTMNTRGCAACRWRRRRGARWRFTSAPRRRNACPLRRTCAWCSKARKVICAFAFPSGAVLRFPVPSRCAFLLLPWQNGNLPSSRERLARSSPSLHTPKPSLKALPCSGSRSSCLRCPCRSPNARVSAARLFARAEAQGLQVRSCLALPELRERVADLPLFLLDWPGKTLAHLADLGVLRLRDVLALPAEGIARRFGPGIVASLDRLLGRVPDPREPYSPPPRFRSRLELPAEAEGVEALVFPLRRLLAEFEGAMRARGAGVQHLTLILVHGRKAHTRLPLDFSSPEREAGFILAIASEKLGRLTLPAPTLPLDF